MKFNLSRFALTIRKEVSDSRRALMTFAVGSVASIFVADTVLLINNAHSRMSALIDTLGSFNVSFIMIAASFAASAAFGTLGKKATAASALMLPALEMEKFLSRWVLAVPFALLLLIVSACVGNLCASVLARLIFNISYLGTFGWSQYIHESLDVSIYASGLLFVQSFFFLGSLLWPRYSWCKSLLGLIVLIALCTLTVMTIVMSHSMPSSRNLTLNIIGHEELIIAFLALTVINYITSYFRFRETEIINRW